MARTAPKKPVPVYGQPMTPIRIDPDFKAWLAEHAQASGTTFNDLLRTAALKEALAAGADPHGLDLPATRANENLREIIANHKEGSTAAA